MHSYTLNILMAQNYLKRFFSDILVTNCNQNKLLNLILRVFVPLFMRNGIRSAVVPLDKGNEDSGNEIGPHREKRPPKLTNQSVCEDPDCRKSWKNAIDLSHSTLTPFNSFRNKFHLFLTNICT